MFVLIVGGGRTGSHLAALLLAQGHDICVMEHRSSILADLHRELATEYIFEGDGTDPQHLEAAGVRQAQVVAVVTGDDADNLVVASLARHHYGVARVISRVNNPRNAWLFSPDFGVDVAVNQADVMAKLIEEEMSLGDMMVMLKLRRGKFSLVEEKIFPDALAMNKAIKDLPLPQNCVIAGIIRHGEIVMPRGVTVLEEADEVLALVDDNARIALSRLLGRREEVGVLGS